jgi:hypothetical protein
MWQLKDPEPVKLIIGILAADLNCLHAAVEAVIDKFGPTDLTSHVWPFSETDYYRKETGPTILRQFLCFEKLIDPEKLAKIKLITNKMEKKLAKKLGIPLSRPVNLDPGIIEPGKLILATTKNFCHRIYIGKKMYAEVTLIFSKGAWQASEYTFPDYRTPHYHEFLGRARIRLVEQLKSRRKKR